MAPQLLPWTNHWKRLIIDAMLGITHFVYILTNYSNTVLYTGQTHDLLTRLYQHREGLTDGFTKKYKVTKLVYYEVADDLNGALYREKQSNPIRD